MTDLRFWLILIALWHGQPQRVNHTTPGRGQSASPPPPIHNTVVYDPPGRG